MYVHELSVMVSNHT